MDISVGSIAYHHQYHNIATPKYEKCIGNCQAIITPLLDLGFGKHHIFAGANSIARPMAGYRYNFPINSFTNLTAGSYYQDKGEFLRKGMTIDYVGDIMPIAGLDLKYKKMGLIVTYPISVLYMRF